MERTPPTPEAPDSGAKKARDAAAESLKKMGGAGVDALKRTPEKYAKLSRLSLNVGNKVPLNYYPPLEKE